MPGRSAVPGSMLASPRNHGARNVAFHFNTKELFRLPVANDQKSKVFSILVEITLANPEFLLKQKLMMQECDSSLCLKPEWEICTTEFEFGGNWEKILTGLFQNSHHSGDHRTLPDTHSPQQNNEQAIGQPTEESTLKYLATLLICAAPSSSLNGSAHCTVCMHPDIKDTTGGELGHAMLSLPNSYSLAYAAQEPPTAPASGFLLGGICLAAGTGGWEGTDRIGSRGPLFLGGSNMTLAGESCSREAEVEIPGLSLRSLDKLWWCCWKKTFWMLWKSILQTKEAFCMLCMPPAKCTQ